MKELIKQILREELTSTQEKLFRLSKSLGIKGAADFVGGIDRYINIMYGGDFEKFVKDSDVEVVSFSKNGLNMYLHPLLVELIGLPDKRFVGTNMKQLGKFSYGPKDGIRYSFTADLMPLTQDGEIIKYLVVGTSGDSGFGYSFITKRNTLAKRARQQIYQQIIDKYNLQKYIK